MAIHSIDYLNARRARMPAGGGTNYRKSVNPVDIRAKDADIDPGELLHEQVRLVFADFRAWFAASTNDLHAQLISPDLADDAQSIPF